MQRVPSIVESVSRYIEFSCHHLGQKVFIHPSCQLCLIVTGGYLGRIFNLGSAELRLPLTYLWMYAKMERGVLRPR